jgi:hypothetical protein
MGMRPQVTGHRPVAIAPDAHILSHGQHRCLVTIGLLVVDILQPARRGAREKGIGRDVSESSGVLYCGSCGALNPRSNHFCSACGHQLVDAFHASEGLRVYATPDPGASLIEILESGSTLSVVETDELLPADFVKVTLVDGRVGYVRLREVEAAVADLADAAPRTPVGCISSTAVLAILALLILTGTLVLVLAFRSSDPNAGFIAALACITVVPFILFVVGFYLYVRKREEELLSASGSSDPPEPDATPSRHPADSLSD